MKIPSIHPEDEESFLTTLNKKGFLLESKVGKILLNIVGENGGLLTNYVIDKEERREIDFVLEQTDHILIIECKKTDYSWIFPKDLEKGNTINLIYGDNRGIKVKSRQTSDFEVAWSDLSILFDENGRLVRSNDKTVRTSNSEIHSHVRQALKELEAYISHKAITGKIIIPLIVTNAKLFQLKYSLDNIDSRGNLKKYESFKEIPGLLYNFPEVIKYKHKMSTVRDDEVFSDHVKSIFILNMDHLKEMIPSILDQNI